MNVPPPMGPGTRVGTVSAGMIRHKELVRADEAEMRRRAREELEKHVATEGEGVTGEDVELGKIGKV